VKDLDGFLNGFFSRHPHLRGLAPSRIVEKTAGGSGSHPEARQHADEIQVFPKFWTHDEKTQDWIMAHEIGHFVQSRRGTTWLVAEAGKNGIDPWDSSSLPFGQFNMEEAFADCFASYHLNPSELKHRYPAWVPLVEHVKLAHRVAARAAGR